MSRWPTIRPTCDPATHQPIDPEMLGVLTLAAAQPNQEAREVQTEDGAHGAFTWALAQSLRYAAEPVERVFARTVAALGANGALQQPAMGGPSRFSKTIFGQPPAAGGGLGVVVDAVNGADIHLRGGTAIGLFPKCRLKTAGQPAATVEIVSSEGLGGSIARVIGQGSVKPGDVLTLDRWVVPAKAGLRVWMPKPAPEAAFEHAVAEFEKLRADAAIEWIDDPTAGAPTHIVSWNGTAWIVETNPAGAKPGTLGAGFTAADVAGMLPPKARLLVRLPPTTSLLAAIPLGDAGHSAVEIAAAPAGAQYWFWGKMGDGGPAYAWLLPDATGSGVRVAAAGQLPLPVRSDWVRLRQEPEDVRGAGAELTNMAMLLARIRAWLTLQSPPAQENFPYHLAFRQVSEGTLGEFKDSGDFKEGEQYKLYLRADPSAAGRPRCAGAALGLRLRHRPFRRRHAHLSAARPRQRRQPAALCPGGREARFPTAHPAHRRFVPRPISKSVRPSEWIPIFCSRATTPSTIRRSSISRACAPKPGLGRSRPAHRSAVGRQFHDARRQHAPGSRAVVHRNRHLPQRAQGRREVAAREWGARHVVGEK